MLRLRSRVRLHFLFAKPAYSVEPVRGAYPAAPGAVGPGDRTSPPDPRGRTPSVETQVQFQIRMFGIKLMSKASGGARGASLTFFTKVSDFLFFIVTWALFGGDKGQGHMRMEMFSLSSHEKT